MSEWFAHHNWLNVVRDVIPGLSDTQAREILWTKTSYPEFDCDNDRHRIEQCQKELMMSFEKGETDEHPLGSQV